MIEAMLKGFIFYIRSRGRPCVASVRGYDCCSRTDSWSCRRPADAAPPASWPRTRCKGFAIQWFAEMQAGKIDRSLYAPAYVAQVTPEGVRPMSRDLNQYGASPLRAEIMKKRSAENQTFYLVKFVFPRGDATSLLFGFDAGGRITGIGVESMAGD